MTTINEELSTTDQQQQEVSFLDIKNFLIKEPYSSIQHICSNFNKSGEGMVENDNYIIAVGIDTDFWISTLRPFIKEPYVKMKRNHMNCLITDRIAYRGRKEQLYGVLYIEE